MEPVHNFAVKWPTYRILPVERNICKGYCQIAVLRQPRTNADWFHGRLIGLTASFLLMSNDGSKSLANSLPNWREFLICGAPRFGQVRRPTILGSAKFSGQHTHCVEPARYSTHANRNSLLWFGGRFGEAGGTTSETEKTVTLLRTTQREK